MLNEIELLRNELRLIGKPADAAAMQAYMKGHFVYFGVKSDPRREISKAMLNQLKQDKGINWSFVFECYEQEEREFQYIANDYLRKVQRRLVLEDLPNLRSLILSKSWWDTVDALAIEIGAIFQKHPDKITTLDSWISDDNIWIRRAAIIHQLKFKDQTNLQFLKRAIEANLGSREFFINKAIGWALRAFGDTNPQWVMDFAATHDLAALSKKEALRKIK